MSGYASGTSVSADRSVNEIKALLQKAGASRYAFGEHPDGAMIQFELLGLHYRFEVVRPTWETLKKRYTSPQNVRDHQAAVDAEWRRRWRARVLWIKAQLEFAADEPGAFQQAMLSSLLLPDGQTFGRWAVPQIEAAYERGAMPPLLTAGGGS